MSSHSVQVTFTQNLFFFMFAKKKKIPRLRSWQLVRRRRIKKWKPHSSFFSSIFCKSWTVQLLEWQRRLKLLVLFRRARVWAAAASAMFMYAWHKLDLRVVFYDFFCSGEAVVHQLVCLLLLPPLLLSVFTSVSVQGQGQSSNSNSYHDQLHRTANIIFS